MPSVFFSGTGADNFGETVPPGPLVGGRAVRRGSYGLVQRDIDDVTSLTFVQRVTTEDHPRWLTEKRSGAGRGPCLNEGDRGDSERGCPCDSLATMKNVEQKHWMFNGPSAAREVLDGIPPAVMEPPSYFVHHVGASGLNPNRGRASELKHHFTVVWVRVSHDRLDVHNVGACEYVAWRIFLIRRAVTRQACSPDFSSLESCLANLMELSGGLITREFERYVAGVQRGKTQILKQQMLAKEEAEALEKRTKTGKGEKGGGRGAAEGSS